MPEDVVIDVVANPVKLGEPLPLLTTDQQQLFLHHSTASVLCGDDDGLPERVLQNVEELAVVRVRGRGVQDRAEPVAQAALLDKRYGDRLRLRDALANDRARDAELAAKLGDLGDRAETLRLAIGAARTAELARRIGVESATLEEQRRKAVEEQEAITSGEHEKRRAEWDAAAAQRAPRAARIEQLYERQQPLIAHTAERAAALNQRLVTKTVAGFLSWLGYASVPATGAAFAALLSPSFSFDWIVLVAKSFTERLPGSPLLQFGELMLFFTLCVAALLGAVIGVDWCLARFDGEWTRRHSTKEREPRIGSTEINRRSFVRLVSALPYVFAGCMVLSFVAVGGRPVADRDPLGVFQTISYTFVGSAIALLATAAFMMYALRIIEPREERPAAAWRDWEFVLAPLAMVVAIAVAVLAVPNADRFRWGAWTLFMLLSSLCLAYGLVYHGVYKDAEKAAERGMALLAELRAVTEPPERPVLSSKALAHRLRIEEEYAKERLRLERLARGYQLPIGRRSATPAPPPGKWRRVLRDLVAPAHPAAPEPMLSLDEIDAVVAPGAVAELRRIESARERLLEERNDLRARIRLHEELSSVPALEQIEDRLTASIARRDALLGLEAEVEANVREEFRLFGLGVHAAVTGAQRARDGFREAAGATPDRPTRPAPRPLLPSADGDPKP
jgi:hypothetical protein